MQRLMQLARCLGLFVPRHKPVLLTFMKGDTKSQIQLCTNADAPDLSGSALATSL